jgi:protein-arginine kinase activator protein McsA
MSTLTSLTMKLDIMTKKELDYVAEKVADAIVEKLFNSENFEVSSMPSATDEQMIIAEVARLMTLLSQYEESEEYEKAAIIQNKITKLEKILKKL